MNVKDKYSFRMEGTNGEGILLLHGLTGVPAEMKLVARRLNRTGYSIYAPLLAGHGVDRETLIGTGWKDWLEGVVADAEFYGKNVNALYTAGICVGGKLGLLAAQRLPHLVKAAAIYSPCFRFDGCNTPWYYKLAPVGLPIVAKLPIWRKRSYSETESLGIKDDRLREFMQSAETEGVIDQFPISSLLEMYRLGQKVRSELPHMNVPTLVLHAAEDDLSHPRNAKLIANRIGAKHELHWIDDSYHMIHVDRQHGKVSQLTSDFFKAQEA